jgi:hypothetical protein
MMIDEFLSILPNKKRNFRVRVVLPENGEHRQRKDQIAYPVGAHKKNFAYPITQ